MTYAAAEQNILIPPGIDAIHGRSTHLIISIASLIQLPEKTPCMTQLELVINFQADNEHLDNTGATTLSTLQPGNNDEELRPMPRKMRR